MGVRAGLLEGPLERELLLLAEADATFGVEGLEGEVAQLLEVAQAEQPLANAGAHGALAANANLESAEIRMAERGLQANVAQPVAVRAVRVAELVARRRSALAPVRRRGSRRSAGEPSQCFLDPLAHPSPRCAIRPVWRARSSTFERCCPRRCG